MDLPQMKEEDDILIQLERLKMGLVSRATGGEFDHDEYRKLRKLVMGIPGAEKAIPRFLKICTTPDDFWGYIKGKAPSYAERTIIIAEEMSQLFELIEYEVGEGALEFKKNYEEKEIIGKGGFGLVYLYEHKLLKLLFAVKVFAPAFYEGGEKEMERFFQEARMLFKLNHPSIIKVYDAGLIGKRPFIRMEYFKGLNLNEVLVKHGVLIAKKALIMIQNIVEGLRYAHEEVGLVHRDLKPSNIMVAPPNQFRIIDFGLGVFIENELHTRFTKTGENVISGLFNAPELINNPKLIDKRSDIYSIGAIWFTMITGQPPAGTTIIKKIEQVSGVTKQYSDCIAKCLSDLDHRFADCEELLHEIRKLR